MQISGITLAILAVYFGVLPMWLFVVGLSIRLVWLWMCLVAAEKRGSK